VVVDRDVSDQSLSISRGKRPPPPYLLTEVTDTLEQLQKRREEGCFKILKPFGFSWFPKEPITQPRSWIADQGELVYFKHHESVGFALLG
jgi:hypothetical protein